MSSRIAYNGQIFTIEFYVTEDDKNPVEEWLEDSDQAIQKKFAALLMRLGDTGKIWNEQKFKHLEGSEKIYEFKPGKGRVLCFFFIDKKVILTNAFLKKSQKTPKAEIELAEKRRAEYIKRYEDEQKLVRKKDG
jgi:phage-related protein